MNKRKLPHRANRSEIDAFLQQVKSAQRPQQTGEQGRVMVAIDATASREPTWDHACHIQGQMFSATAALGGIAVKLCYYRGFDEFHHSDWHANAAALLAEMTAVRCLAGHTQIARVLRQANSETEVNAVVFIGDAFEEDINEVRRLAGQLGLRGVPVFVFQEGHDPVARSAFHEIARLSHGACIPFDLDSASQLRDLLGAVAVFACGGYTAMQEYIYRQDSIRQNSGTLLQQLAPPDGHDKR